MSELLALVKKYLETRTELLKLQLEQQLIFILRKAAKTLIRIGGMLVAFFFFCVAGALWLNELLESTKAGFLIIGGFIMVLVLVLINSKWYKNLDKEK